VSMSSCSNGNCTFVCLKGWSNCDGNSTNGCETNIETSNASCGSCANNCGTLPNAAGAYCNGGDCIGYSCSSYFGDCLNSSMGCPTDLNSSVTDCGTCGHSCPAPNNFTAYPMCTSGICSNLSCANGTADCNLNATDGCETLNISSNVQHCGICTNNCSEIDPIANHFSSVSCSNSDCTFVCDTNWSNCDGNQSNGCETNASACSSCQQTCNGTLPQVANYTCSSGSCAPLNCSYGYSQCSSTPIPNEGCTIDLLTDGANCGSCNNDCMYLPHVYAANTSCVSGVCNINGCNAPYKDCDGKSSDGCETDVQTSASNCGSCGLSCGMVSPSQGFYKTASCSTGKCVYTCVSGHNVCSGSINSGCQC